jgi:uncharacterized protein YunC (DUF1805 family)
MGNVEIIKANSVTALDTRHRDCVLISGSHGGLYTSYLAANAGVRGVILNDAGVGKDDAGIQVLDYFDAIGRPAATVSHASARIGDAEDMAARGRISHVNKAAERLGCRVGARAIDCAEMMRAAPSPTSEPPAQKEGRNVLRANAGEPEVIGMDSVALVEAADAARVVVGASHGALMAGDPKTALGVKPVAAVFNDAGVGIDQAGLGRLPPLDEWGVPAATVAASTARIGDARSMWATGIISHFNRRAAELGIRAGMTCQEFVETILRQS